MVCLLAVATVKDPLERQVAKPTRESCGLLRISDRIACLGAAVLVAYIDEIGEPGAFVSKEHKRFKTSPAFGYAGFVIDESRIRDFGALFVREKGTLFAGQIPEGEPIGRWERKGSDLFSRDAWERYPAQIRVFRGLVSQLKRMGGKLFYYADEKQIGTENQVRFTREQREQHAMQEMVNRLCTHAYKEGRKLIILMDQVNEKQRREHVARMYAHIFSRSQERQEMLAAVEPPMHLDSELSSGIQFADWVAAAVSRAIDCQLIADSKFTWVGDALYRPMGGVFTHESKLHLFQRSVPDLRQRDIFSSSRPVIAQPLAGRMSPDDIRKMQKVRDASQVGR